MTTETNSLLKQRLVGALILAALAVVFWPIIFVTPPERSPIVLPDVAPKPVVSDEPISMPDFDKAAVEANTPRLPDQSALQQAADVVTALDNAVEESTSEEASELPVSDEEQTALAEAAEKVGAASPQAPAKAEPVIDRPKESGKLTDDNLHAVLWVLQVASVGTEARAKDVVKKLQADGHKAFYKQAKSGSKTIYRIQIGPKTTQKALDSIKATVDKQLKVKSVVLRYEQ